MGGEGIGGGGGSSARGTPEGVWRARLPSARKPTMGEWWRQTGQEREAAVSAEPGCAQAAWVKHARWTR